MVRQQITDNYFSPRMQNKAALLRHKLQMCDNAREAKLVQRALNQHLATLTWIEDNIV